MYGIDPQNSLYLDGRAMGNELRIPTLELLQPLAANPEIRATRLGFVHGVLDTVDMRTVRAVAPSIVRYSGDPSRDFSFAALARGRAGLDPIKSFPGFDLIHDFDFPQGVDRSRAVGDEMQKDAAYQTGLYARIVYGNEDKIILVSPDLLPANSQSYGQLASALVSQRRAHSFDYSSLAGEMKKPRKEYLRYMSDRLTPYGFDGRNMDDVADNIRAFTGPEIVDPLLTEGFADALTVLEAAAAVRFYFEHMQKQQPKSGLLSERQEKISRLRLTDNDRQI